MRPVKLRTPPLSKEPRLTDKLRAALFLFVFLSTGFGENDHDLNFCGKWRHGNGSFGLSVNISTGCNGISISANESFLSIDGQITAQCKRYDVIHLTRQLGLNSLEDSDFCLYWEPLLDQLKLQIRGENLTLCWPNSLQGSCCMYLSHGPNTPEAAHGIVDGKVKNDIITNKILTAYNFNGTSINCRAFCDQVIQGSTQVNLIEESVMEQQAFAFNEHPFACSSVVEMKEDFKGDNVTFPLHSASTESSITVHIPPALKQAAKETNKVVCTFFKNNSLFQEGLNNRRVLNDVVEITVENEIVTNLSEPIRIGFHHVAISKINARKCVSWDTRKDPLKVNWLVEGCETLQHGEKFTECLCNHLTYFSILVQLEPRPVCHLLELTAITSLGCAVSVISCVAVIVFFCRKSKRSKEQSIPIHLGLAVSFAFLNLLFFLTGVLANVGGDRVCTWVAVGLHYSLLSSLTWMGIEVFHTFWLVYMVFRPSPKPYVWNLLGFIVPAVPVGILVSVGDIYGVREVRPCEDIFNPYLMCWMKDTNEAWLAHYFTNMTILFILVTSGLVMLFLVYREIRTRDEWKQNRVAFLSIWGLSCLYGTTWGLTFLGFGPLSEFIFFLTSILSSFQGFFVMLRFYILDCMRKRTGSSTVGSTSIGSTRQSMLQMHEKS